LRPNLLSLSGVDVITTTWDEALTTSLPVPYILTAPQDAGFHRLDVYYHLFDGSTTQSTHWVYIYQDTINDYDGDGLSDFDEVTEYATEPVIADTDNDGLNDGDEAAARTDPLNPDSDYDDIPDGQDSDALFYSDLTPDPAGPAFNKVWPTEGTIITVSATISDVGSHDAKGVVVAFFDGDPEGDGSYICADFITSVPTTTSALAECVWDTTGVTGTREIYVVADPVDRIVEEDENNNSAHSSLTILTKPDLWIASLTPAETEVVEGQSITVTAVVQNSGQTDAPTSTLALYQGTTMNGTLVHSATVAVSAGEAVTAPLPWTATALGPQSLTSRADLDDDVDESREDNNDTHTDVYVGWGSPIYVDAGGDPDPVYSPSLAYGLLSENTTVIDTCGDAPYQTYRQGVYGEPLEYRFDHLLPSHYYHLDTTYSVCGGQRVEHLWVDSGQVGGPLTVTASAPVCHSTLVDPAVYGDHSIVVGVTASGLAAPAVAELGVNDIYHCYRDSGSAAGDPPYAPGIQCGYYDPLTQGSDLWGSMPVQTVRFDPNDSDVVYRFSGLEFTKRYVAHLRLYEGDGTGRQETVRVDGVTVGPTVTLSSEPQVLVVDIPPEAYEGDGIVDVAVVETTGWNVPVVSEIAVEEVTLAIPTAAQLVAPATGHTISDTTPTFAWDAAHGASAYRLQVDEDPGFGSPEIDESTASASYTPTVPLDFGTYHWRVRASNGCGDGPWSLVWSVTITNSAPSLSGLPNIVFDHSTGPTSTVDLWAYTWDAATPVDQLSYVISGTPPSGAGLTLADNRTVHVEPSAAWCGYTDVTIRATDPEGLWDEDTFRVAVTWSCQGPLPVPSRAAAQDEPITLDLTPYEPQVGDGTGLVWYATEEERCAVSGEYSEDDVLTFTPEAGFLGNDAVTLHMVYPWGSEATQELMLTWDSAPPMELELYLPVVTRDCP
jgi:hypothetical protein